MRGLSIACRRSAVGEFVDIREHSGYIVFKIYSQINLVTLVQPEPRLLCVIFDVDGTLARTNELIFASFNHVAAKYLGKTLAPQEIIALFGPPEEGALTKLLGREKARVAMDELCEYYRIHHKRMASLHTGMEEVLRFLKDRKLRLAIFTGKGKRTLTITLQELGIAHYFDMVVSGTDVVHHKPHPEGIQRVLRAFDVQPSRALMVGDALSDVKASRAAGVRIAAALWDSHDRAHVEQGDTDLQFLEVEEMYAWFRAHLN